MEYASKGVAGSGLGLGIAGTALGLVSGFLVAKCRLQAFIATLITMTAYRGLAMIITDGKPISRLANSIESDSGAFLFKALGKGNLLIAESIKIPLPAIILVAFFALFFFVLNKTTYGRQVYAVGGNEEAARLAGISYKKVRYIAFMAAGVCAAIAGLVNQVRIMTDVFIGIVMNLGQGRTQILPEA